MADIALSTFTHAGKTHTFLARLETHFDGKFRPCALHSPYIETFQYSNRMNQMFLTGYIIYTDKQGEVDYYLDKPEVYCRVEFFQHMTEFEGDLSHEKPDERRKFVYRFMFTGATILSREHNIIKYRLNLIGLTWVNCLSLVSFSNYGLVKQPIFDIIKLLMLSRNLKINALKWDTVVTPVTINYMTGENDTLMDAVLYLMHKLYYYEQKELSLKFIVYNEILDSYLLFDISNYESKTGVDTTELSFFETLTELMLKKRESSLGMIMEKPKTLTFRNLVSCDFYDYDLNSDLFINKSINSKELMAYRNKMFTKDIQYPLYVTKTKYINERLGQLEFRRTASYWNNDFNFYWDFDNELFQNNSLVINTPGDILRLPGSFMNVSVGRASYGQDSNTSNKLSIGYAKAEWAGRYKFFEGTWVVGKVTHLISPSQSMYNQNLLLFRNFTTKQPTPDEMGI